MKIFLIGFVSFALLLPLSVVADAAKGKTIFDQRCVTCHGTLGAGDGPIGLSLPEGQKPASLQSGVFKIATSDDKMKEVISKGGAAHGLNPLMPPHPDLTPEDLTNLVEYVKSLKK